MKYVLMCGGDYEFKKPLCEVRGEKLVERTIRLLKENNVDDIVISTNHKDYDYLGLPIIKQKKKGSWLCAYVPMEEPCCYIHADVYYSDECIKTIVETDKEMFFCVRDLSDGRPLGINAKGREPLAYKVYDNDRFNKVVEELLDMENKGEFAGYVEPFGWHVYRYLSGLDIFCQEIWQVNDIFKEPGNYTIIDDYTTDVDTLDDIKNIENVVKFYYDEIPVVKLQAIESFTLERKGEIKNLIRNGQRYESDFFDKNINKDDIFECREDIANYLLGDNGYKRAFVKILELKQ